MIRYITGDLVKDADQFDVIAHCANCFHSMGSGIAPQIKDKFPEAYAADCATKKGDLDKLGTISHTTSGKPIVVNLYGQYDYTGRRSGKMDLDYDAIRKALIAMKEKFSGKTMAMPKIGAGLAGGDWTKIEAIIDEVMRGEYVTIVLWESEPSK
jgi:O-acetyl-ADP-ribose deacetylase (regulator of RNase III)